MPPPRNRALGILRNATSNYVRQLLQIVVLVLLTPYIVRQVGTDDFGLWSLIQATIGLLGLMDLGFSTSVVKFVAEARGKGDAARLRQLTATFFWQYTALGAAMLAATLLLLGPLPGLLDLPEGRVESARLVFLLVGLRAALGLPLGLFAGILVGYQKQVLSNLCRVVGTVSYGLVAWWALAVSPSIETLSWASLATGVGANVLSLVLCLRHAPGMSLSPAQFRWGMIREISTFSLWFFLIQVSLLIATRVDTIIINGVLPLAAVAVYTVAIRVAEKASALCRQLTNALTPVIAELRGAGEESNIRAVFLKGSMLSVALSAPILVGLAWLAEDLCVAWMGEDFRGAGLPCQLLGAALVGLVHGNTENILSMTGHQKHLALATLGGQALNLALTLALIKPLGLAGVALAAVLAQAAVQLLAIQPKAGQIQRVSMAEFYWRTLWPSAPGSLACVGAIWGLPRLLPPTSLWSVAVLLAAGGVAFVPAFWFMGLPAGERQYFAGRFRALLDPRGRRGKPGSKEPAA